MEGLFDIYLNVNLCMTEYRKYKPLGKLLDFNQFCNTMHIEECVLLKYEGVAVYVMAETSKYMASSGNYVGFISKNDEKHIIVVAYAIHLRVAAKTVEFNTGSDITVNIYLHHNFLNAPDRGPFCGRYRKLADAEVRDVVVHTMANPTKFPGLLVDDPASIWFGYKIGDVIEVTSCSMNTAKKIHYKIVLPSTGRAEQTEIESVDVEAEEP
jgi:DNA-directed RNA polymerase subunit H (RpoH/RPB5)